MNWSLWARQVDAIARLELKRFVLARRWIGVYLVTLAPVVLLFIRSRMLAARFDQLGSLTEVYANVFQFFELRFAFFISSAVVFSQSFRGDILEKTLHIYLLAPVRREVLVIGKYVAGVIFTGVLFLGSTAATHLLIYSAHPEFSSFFFEGPGMSHLMGYLAAALLAAVAYGGIFMLVGLRFKNPGVATLALLAWESLNFAFPSMLQLFSIVHYLQAFLPVAVNRGPFAILTEPTSAYLGLPILLIATTAFLTASGWLVRHAQITYGAD